MPVFSSDINENCRNKKLNIYTKEYCIYCHKLIDILNKHEFVYNKNDITESFFTHFWLKLTTGASTVPYVFMDDEYIGGYTDFIALCKNKNTEG